MEKTVFKYQFIFYGKSECFVTWSLVRLHLRCQTVVLCCTAQIFIASALYTVNEYVQ